MMIDHDYEMSTVLVMCMCLIQVLFTRQESLLPLFTIYHGRTPIWQMLETHYYSQYTLCILFLFTF